MLALAVIAPLVVVVGFALLAARFGHDSRDALAAPPQSWWGAWR